VSNVAGRRREVRSTHAAGLDSVGRAYELIAEGITDVMVAGTTDAPIAVSCFDAIKATSLRWLPVRNEILSLRFWVPRISLLDTALLDTALLDTALLDTALLDTALSLKPYLRTTQGGKRTLNQVGPATDMTGSTSRLNVSANLARQPTLPTVG
jgi:hypothetical protein